ncbi:MAG: hypothetical protein P0Y60_06080 [Candidatus Microbacterium colombiense]|nr:MAG: hypothetical protein P0Y60_06080 [Microbacterium sp.]
MSDRFLVSAVGAVIDIDLSRRDPAFSSRARRAWSDAMYEGPDAPTAVVTDRAELDDLAALASLSTDVTLAALAQRRGDALWMLHAAGLADEEGRVVVLSAPSGTGKTTAARHLSQHYAYVSDETVGIDRTGVVVPYRKPLSIIDRAQPHKAQVALSSFDGGRVLPASLRVAKIVVLDRSEDGPWVPELDVLDLSTALELLAPQTSYLSDAQAPLHLIDGLLRATGGAVRLRYREVDTIDGVIAELLRTEVTVVSPATAGSSEARSAVDVGRAGYARAHVVDVLELHDGRLAVLQRSDVGSQVRVLDGIGPAIWAAAMGASLDEITVSVVEVHGAPEGMDATSMVQAAVDRLVDDGVLVERSPQV